MGVCTEAAEAVELELQAARAVHWNGIPVLCKSTLSSSLSHQFRPLPVLTPSPTHHCGPLLTSAHSKCRCCLKNDVQ